MRRIRNIFLNRAEEFLRSDEGPTATEYAVMLALIIVTVIGTVMTLGTTVKGIFESAHTVLKKMPSGT